MDDLNALLEHQEETVARARTEAGELAHGLKTPLAVLVNEARELEAAGHTASAATVAEHTRRMERQVEIHLAGARAAAARREIGARCAVAPTVERLVRTVERLYEKRGLEIEGTTDGAFFRGEQQDLEEMLGNLLDNACKWASSRVAVECRRQDADIVAHVDDDGPGLAGTARRRVFERGARLDDHVPGSGLGLTIVRDLAELYGGAVELAASPVGGLRATLHLPAA